ncbi:precorrin-6A synthase (deacetylating) [Nocardia donostiensis]|uniref:Precorrin-6A synthase (Deacetylating) n=1 Tax=Nocardia donostiensis TaxID=1538463 RepID=A0A1W0BDB5_9NOCA|nr:precorrin-6A synthase (deacetylating) [Nocardia donostiensis]ONM48374.1 precorrin-6A synthase (deacetylating) [Nocardia donostiensis]OQS20515.1 precorrin-6A synthase (deacetylating) [Nocardia donostiensis]
MRKLYVIGIGAGDPDQVTVQAIKAMRQVEVFFVIGKGTEKQELVDVRTTILDEHLDHPYRIVEIADPPRDRDPDDYRQTVRDWHERRSALLEEAFTQVDGVGAILVWGDPSLYDSTLRMVHRVLDRGAIDFDYTVIPGVTSVQALAARHRTVLHRIGEPVHITTGRRLRDDGLGTGSTVVMLDGDCAFTGAPADTHIWWGAYLGMPEETLIEGKVGEVADEIVRRRAALRRDKGWIMDTYLLSASE